MQLHFKKYGEGKPPLMILHGLFGMSDNWHNMARKLSENMTVFTLDLRNHGQSPHADAMDYEVMAEDIVEFIEAQNTGPVTLMGHSMGGKVAMKFADLHPELIKKLIVVDIAPKAYLPTHQKYITAMKSINFLAETRKEIELKLSESIKNQGELLFILKNLYRTDDQRFALKLNLEGIENAYSNISDALKFTHTIDTPSLFIQGEHSHYIEEKDMELIGAQFSHVQFKTVENAGHWVHAENPEGFLAAVQSFLFGH